MSFLDRIISTVVPHDCLGCKLEGRLICAGCVRSLRRVYPCCYRCRKPTAKSLTCLDCSTDSDLTQVQAVAVYQDLAKKLVWKLKYAHAQAAAREMASPMSQLLDRQAWGSLLIVPVPTATSRQRKRGYDQARLLARELSRRICQPYADVLARQNQIHQVGASREQRLQQLAAAFRVTKPGRICGVTILLVDDVVTTGATLEAAARCLRQAGAGQINALVFAQPKLRQAQKR